MYVGLAGLLVANAVRRGSWTALLPVAAFALVVDRIQIAPEEAALRARFGADFEAYRATVPRWLDRRSLTPAVRLATGGRSTDASQGHPALGASSSR